MPNDNNNIELRSEEVQEVMNRIPPAIQRWGITVMAFVVAVFIAIACLVKIPITTVKDDGTTEQVDKTLLDSVLEIFHALQ